MMASHRRFPFHTWIGLAILASAQVGLAAGHPLAVTWLTPISWTGYIAAVDGMVARRQGRSWLTTRRREFLFLALASVGIWLVFEAYNVHLANWAYRGVPDDPVVRDLAYAWSFATIAPAVFETADLVSTMLHRKRLAPTEPVAAPSLLRDALWILAGLAMVTIPLALPRSIAAYLFGAVWLGFFFLIDPLNERLGAPSLAKTWRLGDRAPILALLLAGGLCGLLWEAWNYQALRAGGGHWIYTIPAELRVFNLHYGQMPVLGLLGFPPFALELFSLYSFWRAVLRIDRYTAHGLNGQNSII